MSECTSLFVLIYRNNSVLDVFFNKGKYMNTCVPCVPKPSVTLCTVPKRRYVLVGKLHKNDHQPFVQTGLVTNSGIALHFCSACRRSSEGHTSLDNARKSCRAMVLHCLTTTDSIERLDKTVIFTRYWQKSNATIFTGNSECILLGFR